MLIGAVTAGALRHIELGVVIGIAMIINMIAAGTAGILIPLMLDRLKADPAIASSVFVTTMTDVVGFFAFLGIAGLWFGLFWPCRTSAEAFDIGIKPCQTTKNSGA